jgi:PTH2 family peptidyl-tRNA hydrolase
MLTAMLETLPSPSLPKKEQTDRPQLKSNSETIYVDNNIKQVIVMRKDLKVRRGKEIAQGAHGSMMFLVREILKHNLIGELHFTDEELAWMQGGFAKIVLQVDSEEELIGLFDHATTLGLKVHLVTDAGLTEFDGVPTKTCIAIGPDRVDKINPVTAHLKLY